jgi:two-component system, LytTR family, response regulator LytT
MKSKISNPFYHILFWLLVSSVLILAYGRSWENNLQAFYFIAMLLPVVMGTSYIFNYYLVPYFLLKKKYFWFGLYFFYTLVISLYLQMLVVLFSYIYLANFNLEEMGPNSIDDIISLAFVMYLVVFMGSFFVMVEQLLKRNREIETLVKENGKKEIQYLELVSNRKNVRISFSEILYIESLADYVIVHTEKKEDINSKEKISVLENRLPIQFLRIHRSFIVNTDKISRFNYNEVEIGDVVLNIGRSYKKDILPKLKSIE